MYHSRIGDARLAGIGKIPHHVARGGAPDSMTSNQILERPVLRAGIGLAQGVAKKIQIRPQVREGWVSRGDIYRFNGANTTMLRAPIDKGCGRPCENSPWGLLTD